MKKSIDIRIEKLKQELAELEAVKNDTHFIKPSETKKLIEKWRGQCFSFEGEEQGNVDILLNTISVDREHRHISLNGFLILTLGPDSSLVSLDNTYFPISGSLICDGDINIVNIPYFPDVYRNADTKSMFEQIDKALADHKISNRDFIEKIDSIDVTVRDFIEIVPTKQLYAEKKAGIYSEYYEVFKNL